MLSHYLEKESHTKPHKTILFSGYHCPKLEIILVSNSNWKSYVRSCFQLLPNQNSNNIINKRDTARERYSEIERLRDTGRNRETEKDGEIERDSDRETKRQGQRATENTAWYVLDAWDV